MPDLTHPPKPLDEMTPAEYREHCRQRTRAMSPAEYAAAKQQILRNGTATRRAHLEQREQAAIEAKYQARTARKETR